MYIRQVTSGHAFPEGLQGKWFCSDTAPGTDGYEVIRYLQHDGNWGKHTAYFDSEQQIQAALLLGRKPDFNMDRRELEDRAIIRQDMEDGFADWNDDW